ncbi:MAG: hypothetical protein ABIQ86_12515 [Steroidobacteraceae bacterium]
MSLMPTAPRSIGGVLDDAIRLYRRSLLPCFPIVLITVVLTALPSIWLALNIQPVASPNPKAVLAMFNSPAVWLAYLAIILVMLVTYGALFYQVDAIAHGERLSMGQAFGKGLKRTPTLLGVTILFGLMIVVGTMLLVIPGIYLWGVFQLAIVPATIERTGVFESFAVSRRLVKDNWWRTNVIILVAVIILVVLMMVVGMIAGITAVASGGVTAGALSTGHIVIQQIISSILSLFTVTFFPCILLAVYHDLKLRKDGSDLADRVGGLKPTG